MVSKQIFDVGTDDTDTPSSSVLVQTAESNLDVVTFRGTQNLDLNNLDEFEFIDYLSVTMFKGAIRDTDNGGLNTITGFDFGIELGEIPIRKNFENFTPLGIMEDIITNFTSLTWVANPNLVDGDPIKLLPSQNKKAIELIDFCHKLLGTTHFVGNDKSFNPEYEGEELNPIVLEVGVNCDVGVKGWTSTTDQLVRNLTVNGDTKEVTETILLSGTGSQSVFELSNPYVNITVEHPIGTELKAKLEDSQDGDYEIFKETKKIQFTVDPALGTDNILVTLTYQLQANFSIIEVTQAQILAGINPHHKVINDDSLKEVVDCQSYATKYKSKFGNPLRNATLITEGVDLSLFRANQRILVKDTLHKINGVNINNEFIIKKLTRSFGGGATGIKLEVGDSTQFSYDKVVEINRKIRDLNENTPTAEIFNEGISNLDDVEVDVEIEITTEIKTAILPTNILVYDANRQYTNEIDHIVPNDGFIYINEADFIGLFDDFNLITESGDNLVLENGDNFVTE